MNHIFVLVVASCSLLVDLKGSQERICLLHIYKIEEHDCHYHFTFVSTVRMIGCLSKTLFTLSYYFLFKKKKGHLMSFPLQTSIAIKKNQERKENNKRTEMANNYSEYRTSSPGKKREVYVED